MAGRLVIPKLILGSLLSLGATSALVSDHGLQLAQAVCPQPPNAEPRDKHRGDDNHPDKGSRGERGERRGRGGRGGANRFLFEAVRRDGGPLEFLPLLMHKGALKQIGADEQFSAKLETYLTDMQKRLDEERKAAESDASTDWPKLFKERLEKENNSFHDFLRDMPAEQMDRLVGLFVQYRNLRALSNRVVAIERLGMTSEAAAKLQAEINTIREETMSESNEEMRRLFTDGGPGGPDQASFQHLVRKNQAKVDSRIEKIVDKSIIDKLSALRGKDVPRELLDTLDAPPLPPRPEPRQ